MLGVTNTPYLGENEMSQTSANRSEAFGRLLSGAINSIATYEGRTAPAVEDELGQLLHLSGKTIQRYKAGNLPPEARTVEVLAEAAVRRGYLGREWLGRFLHAARYPAADTLLNQLCPAAQTRTRPPRVYHNLPAPTYSQFVMREQAFTEVLDGLQQRSAAVLVVGLGGNGKTSLAREMAARCLQEDVGAARFDAAVWVSDKDRPGTTNLSVVLDEIARTLDYPGFTQFAHDEKRYEVEQLLRRQRVLLVVDNFETITDGALLTWLLRLPEPSKALITSREYGRAFRNSTIVLDLRGMREEEAQTLVNQRLRMLRMEQLVSERAQLEPLLAVTGGNPKAIEIALGLVKHERRTFQQVIDDLHAARGELFDDLFTRAWALLDEAARRVLMVMTFFPISANGDALAATADVHGYSFEHAVERLVDLALLDVQQDDLNNTPRYALHPLVRVFANAKLINKLNIEIQARERWITHYISITRQVGFCWNDLSRLLLLDNEHETICAVVEWLFEQKRYEEVITLERGSGYYFHVRGLWKKQLFLNELRITAAQRAGNFQREVRGIAYRIEMLSRQGELREAKKWSMQLQEVIADRQIPEDLLWALPMSQAFVSVAGCEYDLAVQAWREFVSLTSSSNAHLRTNYGRRWLATCLYFTGEFEEARTVFEEVSKTASQLGHERSLAVSQVMLGYIDVAQNKLVEAEQRLQDNLRRALHYQDRENIARIQLGFARLHMAHGAFSAARTALAEAIDLFERLGMRRGLAEAHEVLADLEFRVLAEMNEHHGNC